MTSHNVKHPNFFNMIEDIKILTLLDIEFVIKPDLNKYKSVYIEIPVDDLHHETIMECINLGYNISYGTLSRTYEEVVE